MPNAQNDFQCPNCAKLWTRIETLENEIDTLENIKTKSEHEKIRTDTQMGILFPLIVLSTILGVISLAMRL